MKLKSIFCFIIEAIEVFKRNKIIEKKKETDIEDITTNHEFSNWKSENWLGTSAIVSTTKKIECSVEMIENDGQFSNERERPIAVIRYKSKIEYNWHASKARQWKTEIEKLMDKEKAKMSMTKSLRKIYHQIF